MAAASRAAVANWTLPMSMPGDLSHSHEPTTLVPMSAAPMVRNHAVLTASALSRSQNTSGTSSSMRP